MSKRKQLESLSLEGLQAYDREEDELSDKEGLVEAEAEESSRQANADIIAFKPPQLHAVMIACQTAQEDTPG